MDLSDFDTVKACGEGATMEVRHPATGEVLYHVDAEGKPIRPFTIKLAGKDSERVQKVSRDKSDMYISVRARTNSPVKTAVIDKGNVDILVAATLEWDVLLDGKQADNSPIAYREAYSKYPWLYEQVDQFVGARANFLKSKQPS